MATKKDTDLSKRRAALLSPKKREELADLVKHRKEYHLTQKSEWVEMDSQVLGGHHQFGTVYSPRTDDEEMRAEAVYVLGETVDHGGKAKACVVVLRVWADWPCKLAIELNKAMVARVQAENKANFSTRMQTDVQTIVTIMWLRLRGKFFWNERLKTFSTSLYFDDEKRVLRVIRSDDFQSWLQAHTGINPSKADFEHLMKVIDAAAMNPEVSYGVVPGVLFAERDGALYVSSGDSAMVRITENSVDEVPNGEDGVVFAKGKTLGEWSLLSPEEGKDPFDNTQIFGNANYVSPHGRMILRLWFLGLARCFKNYPVLLMLGRFRSGKTRCAQAFFELLGIETAMESIRENGQEDFWTSLNDGGLICYDNVDGKVAKWLTNDMQIASTGGSVTRRKKYSDTELVRFRSNSKIIMTANDPQFATDSGLSDRFQTCELGPFTDKTGKTSEDSKLTQEIVAIRDAAFTWMVYALSRALADHGDVRKNLNKRHPDYAEFAVRCARALGLEAEGIAALAYAEYNKSHLTIVTDRVTAMVYEIVRSKLKTWLATEMQQRERDKGLQFTSSMLLDMIKTRYETDEFDKQLTNRVVSKVMQKHMSEFFTVFTGVPPRQINGKTTYTFTGFTKDYETNDLGDSDDDAKNDNSQEIEDDAYEF